MWQVRGNPLLAALTIVDTPGILADASSGQGHGGADDDDRDAAAAGGGGAATTVGRDGYDTLAVWRALIQQARSRVM